MPGASRYTDIDHSLVELLIGIAPQARCTIAPSAQSSDHQLAPVTVPLSTYTSRYSAYEQYLSNSLTVENELYASRCLNRSGYLR